MIRSLLMLLFVLLSHPSSILAQQPNWEITTLNGERFFADDLISIEGESLLIAYQEVTLSVDINSIGSVSITGDRGSKGARYTATAVFVITLAYFALKPDETTTCPEDEIIDEIIGCVGVELGEISKGVKGFIKALLISSGVSTVSYFIVNMLSRGGGNILELDGKATAEKIAEINIFYAKHTLGRTLY